MNSNFEIEKGVPVPASIRASKYPFKTMKVGDSFFDPDNRAQPAVSVYMKRHGYKTKFVTRKMDGGVRVWRVK